MALGLVRCIAYREYFHALLRASLDQAIPSTIKKYYKLKHGICISPYLIYWVSVLFMEGGSYLFTTIGVKRERRDRKSEPDREKSRSFHLSPLRLGLPHHLTKPSPRIGYYDATIHTERVDSNKSRATSSSYVRRSKLKMNSLTLDIDSLIRESPNRTSTKFKI